jgi:hypothetical protein
MTTLYSTELSKVSWFKVEIPQLQAKEEKVFMALSSMMSSTRDLSSLIEVLWLWLMQE